MILLHFLIPVLISDFNFIRFDTAVLKITWRLRMFHDIMECSKAFFDVLRCYIMLKNVYVTFYSVPRSWHSRMF